MIEVNERPMSLNVLTNCGAKFEFKFANLSLHADLQQTQDLKRTGCPGGSRGQRNQHLKTHRDFWLGSTKGENLRKIYSLLFLFLVAQWAQVAQYQDPILTPS